MKKDIKGLIQKGVTLLGQKIEANYQQQNAEQMAKVYQTCAFQLVDVLEQLSDSNLIKPSVVEDVWALNESDWNKFIFKIDVRKGADEDDLITLKRRVERKWAEYVGCDVGFFRKKHHLELIGGRLIAYNVMR